MLNKHLFAVYTKTLLLTQNGQQFRLQDTDLWLRITKILRLREGEQVILFNGSARITITLDHGTFLSKNMVHGQIVEASTSNPQKPEITLLQSLPKKAVFEEILYNAAQLGVTSIVPVITDKAHSLDFSPKEMIRFTNIIISACEQAKQFVLPVIEKPVKLAEALKGLDPRVRKDDMGVLFDSTGVSCDTLLPQLKKAQHITVLFGPEGGLTDQEMILIEQSGFIKSRLTPTILRSEDAPLVGIGLLRSLIS